MHNLFVWSFYMHGFLYLNGKTTSMVYYFEALTRTSRTALIWLWKMFEYVRRLVSNVLMNACAEMTTGFPDIARITSCIRKFIYDVRPELLRDRVEICTKAVSSIHIQTNFFWNISKPLTYGSCHDNCSTLYNSNWVTPRSILSAENKHIDYIFQRKIMKKEFLTRKWGMCGSFYSSILLLFPVSVLTERTEVSMISN